MSDIQTKSKRIFLLKLAKLMDEYNVAICSNEEGNYSQVFFQFHDKRKGKSHKTVNLNTGRLHSSPYEIRNLAKRMQK